jgi:hypothetical protein
MQRYTATEFATRLGGKPADWGLKPEWNIVIDENLRIVVEDLGGQSLGHINAYERSLLEQRAPMTLRFTGAELERRLGPATVRSLGLKPGDKVTIDKDDWVKLDGRAVGQIVGEDREILEAPVRALSTINRYRAAMGQSPLDPAAAGWNDEDIFLEAYRVARLQNPRSWRSPAIAGFLGRGAGSVLGMFVGMVATVATTEQERERGQAIGVYAGGTLGATAGAFALAPSGRRWRAALGALGANAVSLLALPFGSWWIANGIGAVLTPVGIYLVTRAPTRASNPMSPTTKRWLWIGGIVGGALLLGGGVAYAKMRKAPSEPLPPEQAVREAIQILGENADADDIANAAYPLAHPDCPDTLDPEDPSHGPCIDKWLALRDLAESIMPTNQRPPRRDGAPLPTEGPAADMRAWLDSLTQSQRSQLRDLIGASNYDPIKRAAQAGDDGQTVASVLRLKRNIEKLVDDDPIEAAKQYHALKTLLGPKLDELLDLAEQYSGQA